MSDAVASGSSVRTKGPKEPIPVSILTGFLGSGKTTLLNRLLKDEALSDAAVVINEFGDVGLDHLLVEKADEGIIELSSGCLCCTIRGDLIRTLEDLLRRRDNGRITPFRRLVIETTGLADPAPVLHTIMAHPYLEMRYRLDGVIATVDAVNGMGTLDRHSESVKQAAVADRLVLTKTDLAPEGLDALRTRLRALNPAAPILDAVEGEAGAAALLDAGLFDPTKKIPDVARWLHEEAYAEDHDHHHHDHDHHHHHDHDHAHGHDHGHGGASARSHQHAHDVNRHDDRIRAFSVSTDAAVSSVAFDMFLQLLRSAHGPELLRVKGIVKIAEHPDRPVVVHGVQHVFHPPAVLDSWPDGDQRTRIVFITRDIERTAMQRLLDAVSDRPQVDTPDAAGLDALSTRPRGLLG